MMKLKNKALFLATVGLAILTGLPASAADNPCRMGDGFLDKGIGGTGNTDDTKKGLGGTGLRADNGVGGTGFAPGKPESVYIKGTIYAYGSVCVNGLRVTYDDSTPVTDGNTESKAKDLKLGQFVQILAETVPGSTSLVARSIGIQRAAEGPITRINPAQHIIHVMNEKVVVRAATLRNLAVGQAVRVSGLRDAAGRVVASLIEPKPTQMPDSIVGKFTLNAAGKAFIGATPIVIDKTAIPQSPDTVAIKGIWKEGELIAHTVTHEKEDHKKADYVSIEGYAENKDGNTYVQGTAVYGQHFQNGERVIVSGRHGGDGKLDVHTSHESSDPDTRMHDGHDSGDAGHQNESSDNKGKNEDNSNSGEGNTHDTTDNENTSGENDNSHGDSHDESGRGGSVDSSEDRVDGSGHGSGHENNVERVEKTDSVEKVEKIESIEKVEKVEKIEKIEVEKPEKIEVEKPEKIEVEKPEKIEKIEIPKPEKPDTDSHSGHGSGHG